MPEFYASFPSPFKNFQEETADKILNFVQSICIDETDAAAHLAACLMCLVEKPKLAKVMIDYVGVQTEAASRTWAGEPGDPDEENNMLSVDDPQRYM